MYLKIKARSPFLQILSIQDIFSRSRAIQENNPAIVLSVIQEIMDRRTQRSEPNSAGNDYNIAA
jgi:hypothetical protein